MKVLTISLVLLGVINVYSASMDGLYAADTFKEEITYCSDGDTCTTRTGRKVRFAGIDTREKGQQDWYVSRSILYGLIVGRKVDLNCTDMDKYGRDICTVYYKGVDINRVLVRSGHAYAYRKYSKKYISDEAFAKKYRLGHHFVEKTPAGYRASKRYKKQKDDRNQNKWF